jgi:hypothetical protein
MEIMNVVIFLSCSELEVIFETEEILSFIEIGCATNAEKNDF